MLGETPGIYVERKEWQGGIETRPSPHTNRHRNEAKRGDAHQAHEAGSLAPIGTPIASHSGPRV